MSITNFDDLKKLRDKAQAKGRGSKDYFAFCEAIFDGFPKLYETAKAMNEQQRLQLLQPQILAEIERITHAVITNNSEVVDILWVGDFETFLDTMQDLYDMVGGQADLQGKLFPDELPKLEQAPA